MNPVGRNSSPFTDQPIETRDGRNKYALPQGLFCNFVADRTSPTASSRLRERNRSEKLMTTAARPTWAPAKGGNEQGGTRIFGPSGKYSSRDLAAHTTLKPRKEGQNTQEEVQKRNLRDELEDRERKHYSSKDKSYAEERDRRKSASLLLEGSRREAEDKIVPREIDADDSDVEPRSDDESDEDDDDDDDTEALMAELERIKKERAEEKLRKERQQAEEDAKMKEAELMRGNPLININNAGSFNVKRRWDDDVVFKNQARGETKTPKRFINDTIRSDFHRKFLQRYMK
uniref:Cwf15/Cwc15 cell cycle control protein n=2 Tax=Leersia perrieri TaxID=77586 RepID=A0A0D9WKV7_9ORYZ